MGRFQRSWRLAQASWKVLRADPELLLLPVLSGACIIVVLGVFGLASVVVFLDNQSSGQGLPGLDFALAWAGALVAAFIGLFCNTALVACAMSRLDGGRPTLADGLRIAADRAGAIFGYAVITVTVGMLLRALEERLGFIGRIVTSAFGTAWTVACFLVVPVLVVRDVGPVDAVRHSAQLLRRAWGENLVGHGGIMLLTSLAATLVVIALGLPAVSFFQSGHGTQAFVLMVVAAAVAMPIIVLGHALNGIYAAVLYRYAADGRAPAFFDEDALRNSFTLR